jgi:hypothetical protein
MALTAREKRRFVQKKDFFIRPVCNTCVHNNRDGTCKAFPKGIPTVILKGESKHNKPFRGQKNSLVYEERTVSP